MDMIVYFPTDRARNIVPNNKTTGADAVVVVFHNLWVNHRKG